MFLGGEHLCEAHVEPHLGDGRFHRLEKSYEYDVHGAHRLHFGGQERDRRKADRYVFRCQRVVAVAGIGDNCVRVV